MDSIERKQNYLYDQIINEGYDPEEFMKYLSEYREDGANIEIWTLEELQTVVSKFKQANQRVTTSNYDTYQEQYEDNQDQYQYNQDSQQQQIEEINEKQNQSEKKRQQQEEENALKVQQQIQEQLYQEELQKKQRELEEKKKIEEQIKLNELKSKQEEQKKQISEVQKNNQLQEKAQQNQNQQINIQQQINLQPQQKQQQIQTKEIQQNLNQFGYQSTLPPQPSIPFDQDPFGLLNKKQNQDLFADNNIWNTGLIQNVQSNFNNKNNSIWEIQNPVNNNQGNDLFNQFNQANQPKKNEDVDLFSDFFGSTQQPNKVEQQTSQQKQFQQQINPFQGSPTSQNKQNQQNIQNINNHNDLEFDLLFGPQDNQPKNIQQNLNIQQQQQPQQPQQVNRIQNNLNTESIPKELLLQNQNQKKQTISKISAGTGLATIGAGTMAAEAKFSLVNKLAENQKQQNQIPTETEEQKNQSIQQQKQQEDAQQNAVPYRKKSVTLSTQNQQFIQEKQCKKSVLTVVGAKNEIRVKIQSFQVVQGSLLKQSYAIYHINTMPFNWNVKRHNSDFLWLRSVLVKMYPGEPLPPLPEKTIKTMNNKLACRRKIYFQCFLDEILNNEQLKSSKYVTDFLSISDEKLLKQRQKEIEKLVQPKNLNEIETMTGKYFVNKNPECQTQSQIIEQFLTQNDQLYEKLKLLSKQLSNGYNQVQQALFSIGDIFSQLSLNVDSFNQKAFKECQTKDLDDVYKIMNNIYVKQANQMQEQQNLFENDFYNFFKFHKDSLNGLRDLVKIRNELNSALSKKSENSNQGGGSMFTSIFGKNKEAISCPSKILKELEDQVGYYNFQMVRGCQQILKHRSQQYSKHFFEYLKQQQKLQNNIQNEWEDIFSDFRSIQYGNGVINKYELLKKPQ